MELMSKTAGCSGSGNVICRACHGVVTVGCECGQPVRACDCLRSVGVPLADHDDHYEHEPCMCDGCMAANVDSRINAIMPPAARLIYARLIGPRERSARLRGKGNQTSWSWLRKGCGDPIREQPTLDEALAALAVDPHGGPIDT